MFTIFRLDIKNKSKDFIVRLARSALQTVSIVGAHSLCLLPDVLLRQILTILHFMMFNDMLLLPSLCLSASYFAFYRHTSSPSCFQPFIQYLFSISITRMVNIYHQIWDVVISIALFRIYDQIIHSDQIIQINMSAVYGLQRDKNVHTDLWFFQCWSPSIVVKAKHFNRSWGHCCLPLSHHIALGKLVLWF